MAPNGNFNVDIACIQRGYRIRRMLVSESHYNVVCTQNENNIATVGFYALFSFHPHVNILCTAFCVVCHLSDLRFHKPDGRYMRSLSHTLIVTFFAI